MHVAGKNNMAEVLALGIRQTLLVGRGGGGELCQRVIRLKAARYEKQLVDYSLLNNCGLLSQTAWVQITAVP